MERPIEEVAPIRFMGLRLRLFSYRGRMWIPLVDISRGLGYTRDTLLQQLVTRNPSLFAEEGYLLDLRDTEPGLFSGTEREEIGAYKAPISTRKVQSKTALSVPAKTRPATLLTTVEGLQMVLILTRTEKSDEFKKWAVRKLVPHMIRKIRRSSPLDDMTPEQRIKFQQEVKRIRADEAKRKILTAPMYEMKCNLVECRRIEAIYGRDSEVWRMLVQPVLEACDAVRDAIEGPGLFSKARPEK